MTPTGSPRAVRPWLAALAVIYAAATLAYGMLWIVAARYSLAPVELGFDGEYEPARHALRIDTLYAGAPAERAGLRVGDRIVALDGAPLANAATRPRYWATHQPGDSVRLTIERPGEAQPRSLIGVFRRANANTTATERIAFEVLGLFPIPFILVGIAVLFLRLESPVAWLLALLFGSFTAIPGAPAGLAVLSPRLWELAVIYQLFLLSVVGPLFYALFSIFPARSPLDRRAPWLKWVAIALGLVLAFSGLPRQTLEIPPPLTQWLGAELASKVPFWFECLFIVLGMLSLLWSRLVTRDPESLRRIRVIFWGTLVGVGPSLVLAGAKRSFDLRTPLWVDAFIHAVVLSLFPLSFAYAIAKHRVLDLPVLLKRSARYLLVQRGFTLLLSVASVSLTVLFALAFDRYLRLPQDMRQPVGIGLGAAFGGVLLWGGMRVQRHVGARIDHAFFRSAYDARLILEDLASRTAMATGRVELAHMLESHLTEALHPSALWVYLRDGDHQLVAMSGVAPPELATIAADHPGVIELARGGQCWEASRAGPADPIADSALVRLAPECLVPVIGRDARPLGLVVLGPRLSEEPYSGEDKRLLLSVAGQSAVALENIRLAEEIAGRMETERRVAREIGIAREVQGRLLPQSVPELETLDLAAHCIQARSVGGDYYDFLDLGPRQVGLVLADVSGKGIHAALLMANLQAHLRSQSGISPQDPLRALRQVNHMLWRSTDAGFFATLFLGVYSDGSRRLTFVNCGHNPPVCLRRDGSVEMLAATATVLGAFEDWECALGRTQLGPGDVLVAYSDGITEASRGTEQFGEERLVQVVRDHAGDPAEAIALAILDQVQRFGVGEQSDDLTLLVARAR